MIESDLVTVATSAAPTLRYRIARPVAQSWIDPLAIVRFAREGRSRLERSRVAPQECLEPGQGHISPVLAECKGFGHGGSVGVLHSRVYSVHTTSADLYVALVNDSVPNANDRAQGTPADVSESLSATCPPEAFSISWKSGDARMMFFAAARRRSTASAGRANEVGS